MTNNFDFHDEDLIVNALYPKMVCLNPGVADLELYEFEYALNGIKPPYGWNSIEKISPQNLITMEFNEEFFDKVQLKPLCGNKIILDETIQWLTQQIFMGLITDELSCDWVNDHFYFDIRSFCLFVRTQYYTPKIKEHFGNKPFLEFEPTQTQFNSYQEIGYKAFSQANSLIDREFIKIIDQLLKNHGIPILLALAGPTGAGKTEITEQTRAYMHEKGLEISTIEMDNFFKDKEFRDGKAQGRDVIHYELFMTAMKDLLLGKSVLIPRYDFYLTRSSHDLEGNLRPGQTPMEIKPADVIFLEGNFPFYIPELDEMIGLRIVYLTDDPIRLKRKWFRDIDLRKKYDPVGFVNRYFKTQYFRAKEIYLPLMEVCDVAVDTTAGWLWLTPEWQEKLGKNS